MNRRWVHLAGHLALIGLVWMGTLMPAVASAPKITVVYVYTNPEGTPLARADDDGNIIARYDYKPYGAPVAPVPGQLPAGPGYTGHVNDPGTGLVYMQQRYYDPDVGRFLSVDPVVPVAGNVFNFNRYSYANNSPIVNIDPTGMACFRGNHSHCKPESTPPPPRSPPPSEPEVSPIVQRLRDTSSCGGCIQPTVAAYQAARKASNSHQDSSSDGLSVGGLLVGEPSVTASGMAAFGGGIQATKGLYNSDSSVGIVTPALGLTASADVNIFRIGYDGSSAISPVQVGFGLSLSAHAILGGRLSFSYSPPSNFQLAVDGGVGAGAGFHVYEINYVFKEQ